MARTTPNVTDAELAILEELWRSTAATIREIVDRLYPEGGSSAYATVQKLLERLEKKGCVERDRRSAPHRFAARIGRDELIVRGLQDVADKLCGGSITPLLTQLVRGRRLTIAERQTLDRLIEDLDAKAPKGRGGRPS